MRYVLMAWLCVAANADGSKSQCEFRQVGASWQYLDACLQAVRSAVSTSGVQIATCVPREDQK